jgi:hypothetical protein
MRVSARNFPLVYQGPAPETGTIVTVENYVKWYGLHLVHPGDRIEEVVFPDDDPGENGCYFVDHVPNPVSVAKMARRLGYTIDPMSYEMMVGRWEIEVTGRARDPDDDSPGVASGVPWARGY